MHRTLRFLVGSMAVLTLTVSVASAKGKHPKAPEPAPQDQIQVVGHLPMAGDSVTRLLTTEHYGHEYLYAEHVDGKVTMINLSQPNHPALIAEMSYPAGVSGNVVAAVGNAALITTQSGVSGAAPAPGTFRIMSFADPLHPAVQQEFTEVTAMASDDKRGLIFLANADGLWILQQKLAIDPEFEKEWEHMMLDNR